MRNLKNFFKYKLNIGVCIFLFVTGILKMIYQDIKIFINITPSIPIGLYFLRPYNKEISLEKGLSLYSLFQKKQLKIENIMRTL